VVHDTGNESIGGVKTFTSDPIIPDEAYDATNWNGSLEPPTKNAVRDKIEAMLLTQSVGFLFGNGSDVITVGDTRRIRIPVGHTLIGWSIWSSVSGSIVFRVSRDTWANMPTTTADEISTSRPTLSSTTHNEDMSITDWTSEVGGAGDAYLVDVISVTDCVDVTLELWYTRGIA
jgi:hypothetical protein